MRAAPCFAAALLILPLLCAAASAQTDAAEEDPDAEVEEVEEEEPSPLVGGVWCAAASDPWVLDEPVDADGDGELDEPATVDACDAGLGLALWRWKRLAPVAVVGTKTVGLGVALIAHRAASGRVFAVALGLIAPWNSESGIHADKARLALGATFSFGGQP